MTLQHFNELADIVSIRYSDEPQLYEEAFVRLSVDADKVRQSRIAGGFEPLTLSKDFLKKTVVSIINSDQSPLPAPKAEITVKNGAPVVHWITEGTKTSVAMEMGLKTFPLLVRKADVGKAQPLLTQG